MKTLQQCQEEVAKSKLFDSWWAIRKRYNHIPEKLHEEAAELYASQFKHKWIPVTERLPEADPNHEGVCTKDVLVCTLTGNMCTAYFNDNKEAWISYSDYPDDGYLYNVTHWMPLPEPPKP